MCTRGVRSPWHTTGPGADGLCPAPRRSAAVTPSILGPAAPTGDAGKWDFQYYFDGGGNVLTVSGTVVQQWDPRTGQELAHFDAKVLQPKDAPEGRPRISIGPYPAPNKVDVVTWGDPDVRIVDITTGAVNETVRTTEDVLAVQFDRSGRYFGLMRRGSIVELWRRDPLRRELGRCAAPPRTWSHRPSRSSSTGTAAS